MQLQALYARTRGPYREEDAAEVSAMLHRALEAENLPRLVTRDFPHLSAERCISLRLNQMLNSSRQRDRAALGGLVIRHRSLALRAQT